MHHEDTTKTPWHQDRYHGYHGYHGYHELPGPSLLKPACSEMLTSWKLGPGVSSQLRLLVKYLDETGWLRLNYNIYNDYWHSTYLNLVWYWYALHWALPVASLRVALLWPSAGHWSSTMSSRLSKARFRLTIVSRTLQRFHKRRLSNTETLSNLEANLCSCMFL